MDEALNHFRTPIPTGSGRQAGPGAAAVAAMAAGAEGASPPRVLLLPIHQGANGLNLIMAQHVILVEPLLNPAAEARRARPECLDVSCQS